MSDSITNSVTVTPALQLHRRSTRPLERMRTSRAESLTSAVTKSAA